MGKTYPTAHDIQIQIFMEIYNEEILSNFISPCKTLIGSHKTRMKQLKYAVSHL